MSDRNLITVGFHKAEMDFGVSGEVGTLSLKQIQEMRSLLCTAIYIAEDMWRREQEKKEENKAVSSL